MPSRVRRLALVTVLLASAHPLRAQERALVPLEVRPSPAFQAAVAAGINQAGACNDGFMRDDALLFAGHSESLFHVSAVFQLLGRTVYRLTGGTPSGSGQVR